MVFDSIDSTAVRVASRVRKSRDGGAETWPKTTTSGLVHHMQQGCYCTAVNRNMMSTRTALRKTMNVNEKDAFLKKDSNVRCSNTNGACRHG